MSPIIGLTGRTRLPRLGKIHLGIKVKNEETGVEYPRAVDYFVCPEEVREVYGETPRALPIILPVEDPEKFASQYYRAFNRSRGLVCMGDGNQADRTIDTETGTMATAKTMTITRKTITCEGSNCPDYLAKKCKETMFLQFILPEIKGLGIWQIDTGSINSILNINSTVEMLRQVYGRVAGIPLLLTLEPHDGRAPDGKTKKVWVLHLKIESTMMDVLKQVTGGPSGLLAQGIDAAQLPPNDDEIPDMIVPWAQDPGDQGCPLGGSPSIEPAKATHAAVAKLSTKVDPSTAAKQHPADAGSEPYHAPPGVEDKAVNFSGGSKLPTEGFVITQDPDTGAPPGPIDITADQAFTDLRSANDPPTGVPQATSKWPTGKDIDQVPAGPQEPARLPDPVKDADLPDINRMTNGDLAAEVFTYWVSIGIQKDTAAQVDFSKRAGVKDFKGWNKARKEELISMVKLARQIPDTAAGPADDTGDLPF